MLSFDGESRFDHLREVSQSLTVRLFSKQGSPRLSAFTSCLPDNDGITSEGWEGLS